jgi:hypothetical protein
MKIASCKILFVVLLLCLLLQHVFALDNPDPNQTFVGTWQAQFQGKNIVTIKLEEQNGKLTGTISHSKIQLDNQGELTSAEPQDGEDAFTEIKTSDKILQLTSKGTNGQDTTQYEMEFNGTDQAELRFVDLPSGATAPKPWTLHRAVATARPASMRDKLMSAAQIWMSGQSGNNASTTPGSAATPGSSATSSSTTAPAAAVAIVKASDSPLDADLRKAIDALPRRINDQFNNLGDMVNFVIVGSEQQMQSSLESATWNVADKDSKESALKAVLQTYQKKDYLSMPMSQLYLYGRVQDFGYEMAEPFAVVASRHHFRVWKAPFTWNGQTVWVGAGTHDIGFEKDQRNGKVTHKIDPAVDGERDNIGASLQKADKVKTATYYLPPDPVQTSKNATGGGYHSDGRVLVLILK